MSIYDPRRRFGLSLVVALAFIVVYFVFRATTSPFLDVEREKKEFRPVEGVPAAASEALVEAGRWFSDHPWVETSGKHFRDQGRYLFCRTFELSEDKRSIVVKPMAMMWRAEDSDVPIRIVADSARLFSESAFSLDGAELGEISGGVLSGNVQVRGPDNLRINGGTFRLESNPLKLWSSEPVDCTLGRHSGRANSGVEIFFNENPLESEGTDSIAKVQLLGRVQCQFLVSGERATDEPTRLLVRAARGFVFRNDPSMRIGTFSGLPYTPTPGERESRRIRLPDRDREVWIRRIGPDGAVDELICPELRLTFRDGADPVTGKPDSGAVQLEHLQAWGRLVQMNSPQQGLKVFGNDFRYSVDRRQIDIRYTTNDVSDVRRFVVVRRGKSLLTVPHIRILHTAENEIRRFECLGAGGFRVVPEPDDSIRDSEEDDAPTGPFEGRWGGSLVFQAAPAGAEQYVTFSGGAAVGDIGGGVALSASRITLTMETLEAEAGEAEKPAAEAAAEEPSLFPFSAGGGIRPRLLTASGNVVFRSPQANGTLRENLTVRFLEPPANATPVQTVSATQSKDEREGLLGNETEEALDTFQFTADSGDAEVTLAEGDIEPRAWRVWLNGDIDLERESDTAEDSFNATGNQLVANSNFENERTIQLFGDPARVQGARQNLEGPRIDLNELSGHAEVVGSGRIRFVTAKGLDGQDLPGGPVPIDIYWSDHMVFQSRSARFHGKVRVVMSDGKTQDVELLCSGLSAWFSSAVSLNPSREGTFEAVLLSSNEGADSKDGPIERLQCHDRVEVSIDQFESGAVVQQHRGMFADLKINLKTGDFSATGPGYLESVSPDKEGRLQGTAPIAVRPNAPSQTRDTAFVYLKSEFVGAITGNIDRQEATLSQNVVALMVPTRRVDETIDLQHVPAADLPDGAGILQAEYLTFGVVPGTDGEEDSFSINCRKNARLESREISASADIITFDRAKEQFIIRAEGDKTVTVNHRPGPGSQFNRTSGTRFEYYRKTNQLKADQIDRVKIDGLNLSRLRSLR